MPSRYSTTSSVRGHRNDTYRTLTGGAPSTLSANAPPSPPHSTVSSRHFGYAGSVHPSESVSVVGNRRPPPSSYASSRSSRPSHTSSSSRSSAYTPSSSNQSSYGPSRASISSSYRSRPSRYSSSSSSSDSDDYQPTPLRHRDSIDGQLRKSYAGRRGRSNDPFFAEIDDMFEKIGITQRDDSDDDSYCPTPTARSYGRSSASRSYAPSGASSRNLSYASSYASTARPGASRSRMSETPPSYRSSASRYDDSDDSYAPSRSSGTTLGRGDTGRLQWERSSRSGGRGGSSRGEVPGWLRWVAGG